MTTSEGAPQLFILVSEVVVMMSLHDQRVIAPMMIYQLQMFYLIQHFGHKNLETCWKYLRNMQPVYLIISLESRPIELNKSCIRIQP